MGPVILDEPPPPAGTEESVGESELPDPDYDPEDEEEDDDWDDPYDDLPLLEGRCE